MAKKVTTITVFRMSEKNEHQLKCLMQAESLISDVLRDEEIRDDWYCYDRLEELRNDLRDVQRNFELSFTEKETEEHEEIID